VELIVKRGQDRNEMRKARLQTMRDCPELRNDMLEEERRCEQQEEQDRKMMEMELERNPFHGISRGNQLMIGE